MLENQAASGEQTSHSYEAIRDWLVNEIAGRLGSGPAAIETGARFSSYGIASAMTTEILVSLEKYLNRKLNGILFYQFPTIESLSRHLVGGGSASSAAALPVSGTGSDTLLNEPIAIVGVACRMPEADGPDEFWDLLQNKVNAIKEIPGSRWHVDKFYDPDLNKPGKMNTKWAGLMKQIDQFDADFFGISPREAELMDPQQRIMLELSYEVLEDAGIDKEKIYGSKTGVHLGAMWNDYAKITMGAAEKISQYSSTGGDLSVISGRISYTYGLMGSSVTYNTACSSSLFSVHQACQSIRSGEIDMAMAGGVNLIVLPEATVAMSKFSTQAPDGKCKAFDARANGYVRGEGAGIVLLKPLSRAKIDGDKIYCVIRGSAANNDGPSNGLTAPNPDAQIRVLRDAYAAAGVNPNDTQYVETHGPGTALGDPIEAQALGAVLCQDRSGDNPLILSSVKTQIGHLESAAGIAGMLKVILSIKNHKIPKLLHFEKPNPNIDFEGLKIKVQQEASPWPRSSAPHLAGVNSFGWSGTNVHVILEEVVEAPARPVLLSADNAADLKVMADDVQNFLQARGGDYAFEENASALSKKLSSRSVRLALVSDSNTDLISGLEKYTGSSGEKPADLEDIHYISEANAAGENKPKIAFVCPGQGSQWLGMARELIRSESAFRMVMEQCDREIKNVGNYSIIEILNSDDSDELLKQLDIIQPVLFAIEVALGELWRSWGIEADAIVGHSMGEVAAAYLAGVINLKDAVRVIYYRSNLAATTAGQGGMAWLGTTSERAQEIIKPYGERVSIASSNSPYDTVISGEPSLLNEIVSKLKENDQKASMINVDFASHSSQMDPLKARLFDNLEGLRARSAKVDIYSTVMAQKIDGESMSPKYWVDNLRNTVRFSETIIQMIEEGFDTFIELSPHPVLGKSVEKCAGKSEEILVLPSMKREAERRVMFNSMAALYVRGVNPGIGNFFDSTARKIELPARLEEKAAEGEILNSGDHNFPLMYVFSAQSKKALKALAGKYLDGYGDGEIPLRDISYTALQRRAKLDYRLTFPAYVESEFRDKLKAFIVDQERENLTATRKKTGELKLAFVFSGQGAQWWGMGKDLLAVPAFREVLIECDILLKKHISEHKADYGVTHQEWSILEEFERKTEENSLLDAGNIEITQVSLFALQVALANVWKSYGVIPDAVVGHSMGEPAAMYIAGALSFEDAFRVIYYRSHLLQSITGTGCMAVTELTWEQAEAALVGYEDRLSLAGVNGPNSTVLSGYEDALDEVLSKLEKDEVFYRKLRTTGVAGHSPMTDSVLPQLKEGLRGIKPENVKNNNCQIYSAVTGKKIDGFELDSAYWALNMRNPVLLSPAAEVMANDGYNVFLEISAHPVLGDGLRKTLQKAKKKGDVLYSLKRKEDEKASVGGNLGRLVALGLDVDFANLLPPGGRFIDVPGYPWQKERFWLEGDGGDSQTPDASRGGGATLTSLPVSSEHPFIERHVRLAASNIHSFELDVNLEKFPYMTDHQVQNFPVFPGVAYMETALAIGKELYGDIPCYLRDIEYRKALFVPDGPPRRYQVVVNDRGTEADFKIFSRSVDAPEDPWIEHVVGVLCVGTGKLPENIKPVDELKKRITNKVDADHFYKVIRERGIGYGPAFNGIENLWLSDDRNEGLSRVIETTDQKLEIEDYRFHPAMCDSALQLLEACFALEDDYSERQSVFMPVSVDRVEFYQPARPPLWTYTWLDTGDPEKYDFVGDYHIYDESTGELIAEVKGFRFRLLDRDINTSLPADKKDWLYEIQWEEIPREQAAQSSLADDEVVLIFADVAGVAETLKEKFDPGKALLVGIGEEYAKTSDNEYEINPDNSGDYETLLNDLKAVGKTPGRIIHMWGLNAPGPEDTGPGELELLQEWGSLAIMYIMRALSKVEFSRIPRLFLVTEGAQVIAGDSFAPSIAQSPIWGFGRSIAIESPSNWGAQIDLDPTMEPEKSVEIINEIILGDGGEDQLVIRANKTYGLRLAQNKTILGSEAFADSSIEIRADGAYLVTGGHGELGRELTQWLIDEGARRVILMSRTKFPPRTQWADLDPESRIFAQIQHVKELELRGINVHLAAVDVSDEDSLSGFLEEYKKEGWPAIRGVAHLAGVVNPELITSMTKEDLMGDLRSKVLGGWNLHNQFKDESLDFFTLFSSAAAVLNSPLLSGYSAANTFLDSLAHYRQAKGLCALSVNWGYWEAGMAVRDIAEDKEENSYKGMGSFSPQQGLEIMGLLLNKNNAQVCVMPVNWEEWLEYHPGAGKSPMLNYFTDAVGSNLSEAEVEFEDESAEEAQSDEVEADGVRGELLALEGEEREPFMVVYLQEQIAKVLKKSPDDIEPDKPFGNMGLDSLMALELRNRLEADLDLQLSATMVWNYPSIDQLAPYLITEKLNMSLEGGPVAAPSKSVQVAKKAKEAKKPGKHPASAQAGVAGVRGKLSALEGEEREPFMVVYLQEQIAKVLKKSPDDIEPDKPFGNMGLDSLMALELRNRLEADLDLQLSATMVWNYPSIDQLAPYLITEKLNMSLEGAPLIAPERVSPEPARVKKGGKTGQKSAPKGVRGKLAALDEEDREDYMVGYLQEQIAKVLKRSPDDIAPDKPFGNMGLDSLMALELRNRLEADLELQLSATMVWNHPTIEQLAPYLLNDKLNFSSRDAEPARAIKHSSAGVPVDTQGAKGLDEKQKPEDVKARVAALDIESLSEEEAEAELLNALDTFEEI